MSNESIDFSSLHSELKQSFQNVSLPSIPQQYVHMSKYSRFNYEKNRRETWFETVKRYVDFMNERSEVLSEEAYQNKSRAWTTGEYKRIFESILNLDNMPSMRALMTSGPAAIRDQMSIFNCSYMPINDVACFSEALYILSCGTGLGFSVESSEIENLPDLPKSFISSEGVIIVEDSRVGWAESFDALVRSLYAGVIPEIDVSLVRPAGAVLKTFGGRASGPKPLLDLFQHTINIFTNAFEDGKQKLSDIDIHSILCMVGKAIVSGGVRRCLPEDTLVHSSKGLVPISNLKSGDYVLTDMSRWRPIVGIEKTGKKKTVVIRTSMGDFCCSKEHRVAVLSEGDSVISYQAASEITNQHSLVWVDAILPGVSTTLPEDAYLTIPELDEEVAWFLGYLAENLTLNDSLKQVSISMRYNRESLVNRITYVFQKFGLTQKDFYLKNGYEIYVTSSSFYNYFSNLFQNVPSYILAGKETIREFFLSGVFDAVGLKSIGLEETVSKDGFILTSSLNETYVRQIRSVLCSLGIMPGIEDLSSCVHDIIIKDKESQARFANRVLKQAVVTEEPYAYNAVKVLEVFEGGLKDTYDIEVLEDATFVAEGFLVHNSAQISLSNLDSLNMRGAKSGNWWENNSHFSIANNSAVYNQKPDYATFSKEWQSLVDSYSGERGIFNREAVKKQVSKNGRRNPEYNFGVNPCSEIILRPCQVCNLTEVVARPEDTKETLKTKIENCVIMGVLQSTFTDFRYLREVWKKNADEERLLGVSITGVMDCPMLYTNDASLRNLLNELREHAVSVCKGWCDRFGINMSCAITTNKPAGSVSQLVNSSSGLHTRWSKYQIRTYRESKNSPIYSFFKDSGVPVEDDVMNKEFTAVFSFPMKAPEDAITRNDLTAVEQLELWKTYKENWCEHTPSFTCYVQPDEWDIVKTWVWENFDTISGLSFLPADSGSYQQAPNQECTKQEYEELTHKIPDINWEGLSFYESTDRTEGSQTLACVGGSCEI